jgi:transcriptional regulator with XRE-family HTH domain
LSGLAVSANSILDFYPHKAQNIGNLNLLKRQAMSKLRKDFEDKEYRHAYADEFLNAWIATQIKVLREQRGWSQEELAENAEMLQPRISALENVNYSSWSVKTLRRLAEAFDLTLRISFESFGNRIKDFSSFDRDYLQRPSFNDDPVFGVGKMEKPKKKG